MTAVQGMFQINCSLLPPTIIKFYCIKLLPVSYVVPNSRSVSCTVVCCFLVFMKEKTNLLNRFTPIGIYCMTA